MIEHYLVAASTFASDIDNLVLLILIITGVWFVIAELIFFGFIIKFRAKPGKKALYISGEDKKHKRWINIPHLFVLICDILVIVSAARVWYDIKQNLPEPDKTIRVIAQQWSWSFVQPGADGKIDTEDDIATAHMLNVEVDKTYHFKLQSRDVLHSFSVPVFRLKQDTIPGREITGWFKATKTGEYDIQCTEMCGIGHGIMAARISIRSAEEHAKWVKENSAPVAKASLQ